MLGRDHQRPNPNSHAITWLQGQVTDLAKTLAEMGLRAVGLIEVGWCCPTVVLIVLTVLSAMWNAIAATQSPEDATTAILIQVMTKTWVKK